MADTHDDTASEAARQLVAHRWGAQVAIRAAQTVIDRADQLPESIRAELHQVTGPAGGETRDQD